MNEGVVLGTTRPTRTLAGAGFQGVSTTQAVEAQMLLSSKV